MCVVLVVMFLCFAFGGAGQPTNNNYKVIRTTNADEYAELLRLRQHEHQQKVNAFPLPTDVEHYVVLLHVNGIGKQDALCNYLQGWDMHFKHMYGIQNHKGFHLIVCAHGTEQNEQLFGNHQGSGGLCPNIKYSFLKYEATHDFCIAKVLQDTRTTATATFSQKVSLFALPAHPQGSGENNTFHPMHKEENAIVSHPIIRRDKAGRKVIIAFGVQCWEDGDDHITCYGAKAGHEFMPGYEPHNISLPYAMFVTYPLSFLKRCLSDKFPLTYHQAKQFNHPDYKSFHNDQFAFGFQTVFDAIEICPALTEFPLVAGDGKQFFEISDVNIQQKMRFQFSRRLDGTGDQRRYRSKVLTAHRNTPMWLPQLNDTCVVILFQSEPYCSSQGCHSTQLADVVHKLFQLQWKVRMRTVWKCNNIGAYTDRCDAGSNAFMSDEVVRFFVRSQRGWNCRGTKQDLLYQTIGAEEVLQMTVEALLASLISVDVTKKSSFTNSEYSVTSEGDTHSDEDLIPKVFELKLFETTNNQSAPNKRFPNRNKHQNSMTSTRPLRIVWNCIEPNFPVQGEASRVPCSKHVHDEIGLAMRYLQKLLRLEYRHRAVRDLLPETNFVRDWFYSTEKDFDPYAEVPREFLARSRYTMGELLVFVRREKMYNHTLDLPDRFFHKNSVLAIIRQVDVRSLRPEVVDLVLSETVPTSASEVVRAVVRCLTQDTEHILPLARSRYHSSAIVKSSVWDANVSFTRWRIRSPDISNMVMAMFDCHDQSYRSLVYVDLHSENWNHREEDAMLMFGSIFLLQDLKWFHIDVNELKHGFHPPHVLAQKCDGLAQLRCDEQGEDVGWSRTQLASRDTQCHSQLDCRATNNPCVLTLSIHFPSSTLSAGTTISAVSFDLVTPSLQGENLLLLKHRRSAKDQVRHHNGLHRTTIQYDSPVPIPSDGVFNISIGGWRPTSHTINNDLPISIQEIVVNNGVLSCTNVVVDVVIPTDPFWGQVAKCWMGTLNDSTQEETSSDLTSAFSLFSHHSMEREEDHDSSATTTVPRIEIGLDVSFRQRGPVLYAKVHIPSKFTKLSHHQTRGGAILALSLPREYSLESEVYSKNDHEIQNTLYRHVMAGEKSVLFVLQIIVFPLSVHGLVLDGFRIAIGDHSHINCFPSLQASLLPFLSNTVINGKVQNPPVPLLKSFDFIPSQRTTQAKVSVVVRMALPTPFPPIPGNELRALLIFLRVPPHSYHPSERNPKIVLRRGCKTFDLSVSPPTATFFGSIVQTRFPCRELDPSGIVELFFDSMYTPDNVGDPGPHYLVHVLALTAPLHEFQYDLKVVLGHGEHWEAASDTILSRGKLHDSHNNVSRTDTKSSTLCSGEYRKHMKNPWGFESVTYGFHSWFVMCAGFCMLALRCWASRSRRNFWAPRRV